MVHMQFPIALELFTQTLLIGSVNRAWRHPLYKNLVKINFLRHAIQEPIFFVDRKQTAAVAMGIVLTIALKLTSMSNPAIDALS